MIDGDDRMQPALPSGARTSCWSVVSNSGDRRWAQRRSALGAAVKFSRGPILTDHHERRQDDRFQRHHERQELERETVRTEKARRHPAHEGRDMQPDERHGARERCDAVSEAQLKVLGTLPQLIEDDRRVCLSGGWCRSWGSLHVGLEC